MKNTIYIVIYSDVVIYNASFLPQSMLFAFINNCIENNLYQLVKAV